MPHSVQIGEITSGPHSMTNKESAQDRDKWCLLILETKTHFELLSHQSDKPMTIDEIKKNSEKHCASTYINTTNRHHGLQTKRPLSIDGCDQRDRVYGGRDLPHLRHHLPHRGQGGQRAHLAHTRHLRQGWHRGCVRHRNYQWCRHGVHCVVGCEISKG